MARECSEEEDNRGFGFNLYFFNWELSRYMQCDPKCVATSEGMLAAGGGGWTLVSDANHRGICV